MGRAFALFTQSNVVCALIYAALTSLICAIYAWLQLKKNCSCIMRADIFPHLSLIKSLQRTAVAAA